MELPDDTIYEMATNYFDAGDYLSLKKLELVSRGVKEAVQFLLAKFEPLLDYFGKIHRASNGSNETDKVFSKYLSYYLISLTKQTIDEYVRLNYKDYLIIYEIINIPVMGLLDVGSSGCASDISEQILDDIEDVKTLFELIKETWSENNKLVQYIDKVIQDIETNYHI